MNFYNDDIHFFYNIHRLAAEGLTAFFYMKMPNGSYLGRFLMFDGTDLTVPLPAAGSACHMTIGIGNDSLLVCQDVFEMFDAVMVKDDAEMAEMVRKFTDGIAEWKRMGGTYVFPPRPKAHLKGPAGSEM